MSHLQLKRDASTNWSTANPVLYQGEIGIATDDYKFKIGDGVNSWNDLTYFAGGSVGGADWSVSTVAGTDMTVSTATDVNTLYYPKYITTYNEGTVYFEDANNVTFGSSINGVSTTITASIVPGGGDGGNDWTVATTDGSGISVSTGEVTNTILYGNFLTTYELGCVSFNDSNNVTFGTSVDGVTTIVTASINPAGTVYFVDSNGHSFGSSVDGVNTSIYIVT